MRRAYTERSPKRILNARVHAAAVTALLSVIAKTYSRMYPCDILLSERHQIKFYRIQCFSGEMVAREGHAARSKAEEKSL
jgi:hypothetical protein